MPTSEEMKKLLEMLQSPQYQADTESANTALNNVLQRLFPQEQAAPEQPPIQEVTPAQESATRLMQQAQQQYRQSLPIMNGQERQLAQDLIAAKVGYGTAGDNKELQKMTGLNADELRDYYSKSADDIRRRASDAGMNLTGYGADVTLEDAYRNLQSNDARARIEALTQGQYAMSSDQYFDAKYFDLINKGYSPRQAKKFAGDMAQHYQADRVSYLRGMYNGYGREGDYTNDFGIDLLGEMGKENPTLAQFYGTVYPTFRNRRETLEDKAIEQQNNMATLLANHGQSLERLTLAGQIDDIKDNNRWERENITKDADVIRDVLRQYGFDDSGYQKWKNQEDYREKIKREQPTKFDEHYKLGFQIAKANGLDDDHAHAFATQYATQQVASLSGNGRSNGRGGGTSGTGNGGKAPDNSKIIGNLKTEADLYTKQIEEINSKMTNEQGLDMDPKEKKALLEQRNALEEKRNAVMAKITALNKDGDFVFAVYEDDADEEIAERIRQAQTIFNMDWPTLRDNVKTYCYTTNMTDKNIKRTIDILYKYFDPNPSAHGLTDKYAPPPGVRERYRHK